MPNGGVRGKGRIPREVGRCREKAMWCFLVFQCSTSLIKSSFCPPYPCALESYSFISRIFPLDTCQNKEYGLCISFILLYIRSLSHLNVEPHQRADLSSTRRSALHLGGKSGSAVPLRLLPASCGCSTRSCRATRATGSVVWEGRNSKVGEVLGSREKCWEWLGSSGNHFWGGRILLCAAFIELLMCFCSMSMKWILLVRTRLWLPRNGIKMMVFVCILL